MIKHIAYISLFVFLLSCSTEEKVEINYALLSGSIENPTSDIVKVFGDGFSVEIPLNEENAFADTLWIENDGYYSFAAGRESSSIFLNQGDQLHVSLNTEEFDESINYTGVGAEKNNYLARKYLNSEESGLDFESFFGIDEEDFVALNSKLFTGDVDFLMSSAIPDENFVEMEKKALKYEFLSNISNYEEYHVYLTKDAEFEVSNDFYAKLNGFDYANETDYKIYKSYRTLVANHYIKEIDNAEGLQSTFNGIQSIESNYIKNDLLNNFKYSFSPAHSDLDLFYSLLLETSSDEEFKTAVTQKYEIIKNLTEGNASPSFAYPDKENKVVSLEDLKGKYVYVDVWATWCGPCKREIPYLKEMTKEYEGKDIEFVSISIDETKDYDKWIAMLEDKEMDGIQLFSDKDWNSDFVKAYDIKGIPRFILIDKEGMIVSADAARPSDPKLKEQLEELL